MDVPSKTQIHRHSSSQQGLKARSPAMPISSRRLCPSTAQSRVQISVLTRMSLFGAFERNLINEVGSSKSHFENVFTCHCGRQCQLRRYNTVSGFHSRLPRFTRAKPAKVYGAASVSLLMLMSISLRRTTNPMGANHRNFHKVPDHPRQRCCLRRVPTH